MPIAKKRHRLPALLFTFLLFFGPAFTAETRAQPLPPQDVFVIIDCSESTSPYLDSITGMMSRFISGVQYGDSFTCYQFSNKPVLVAQKEIERQGDAARLKSQLRQLRALGSYTNYASSIEKGLAGMRASFKARPRNERILMLITDGRRHSQDPRSEGSAFSQLLARYSELKGGIHYSFYCFYIGDKCENDLESFLTSAGAYLVFWPEDKAWIDQAAFADVRIMDRKISLGNIPDTPTRESFSLSLYPRRPPEQLVMIEFELLKAFTKDTLDRFFDVGPRRFVCREEPWNETFGFETRGFTRGNYSGSLLFRPSDPRILLLFPRRVYYSFSILEGLRATVPESLNFGPTGFRGQHEETRIISIVPGGADFPTSADAVSVTPDIELPEGIQLNAFKIIKGKEIIVSVTVTRDRTLEKQAAGVYKGTIKLASKTGWTVINAEIPVSVEVARQGVNYRAIVIYLIVAAGCALLMVLFLFAFRDLRTAIFDYLAHKTRPAGKLVIVNDPTRGIAKNINLDRLSEKRRLKEVIVGIGKDIHVELPHRSVIDKKYRFWGLRTKDAVHTIVEAAKGTDEVLVNDISRTGRVQLVHLDVLKMGEFEFRYELLKPLQQMVLYFLSGEIMQGWPLSWNLEAEGFRFLSRAALPERKEVFVRFYELKAAAFVRDFDGELTKRLLSFKVPRYGHHVKMFFADGEELTGYTLAWDNLGEKFHFFPDTLGENVMFFVIEKQTVRDMVLLKENKGGAKRARKKFARVLETMKMGIGR